MAIGKQRLELIKDLDEILQSCSETVENLLEYQKLNQDDTRVSFFKHYINTLDSTILSLVFSHKYLGSEEWWNDTQKEYSLSLRPIEFDREFDYYDQMIILYYFHFTFSSLESSIRLICKRYDPELYSTQKRSFSSLFTKLIINLDITDRKERIKFIDLISSIRNSIHNNGVYVPTNDNEKPKRIQWNKTFFVFKPNRPIEFDIWNHFISISKEILKIYTEIINSLEIKKIIYFSDPMEL
jgi:hypothetical protein